MDYKDMFINYYLKSNKKTFEGEPKDESYEAHLIKLEKIYGNTYANNFKKNAESLISFYYSCKRRFRQQKSNQIINPNLSIGKSSLNSYNLNNNAVFIYYGENMVSTATQTDRIIYDEDYH